MNYPNIRSHLITCPPEAEANAVTRAEGVRFYTEDGRSASRLMFRPPLVITEGDIREVCAVLRALAQK